MIEVKEQVKSILTSDPTLITLLGKIKGKDGKATQLPAVFYSYPDSFEGLPCISYYTHAVDDDYVEGEATTELSTLYLDIWSKEKSTTPIFRRVDALLKGFGFVREFAEDVPDPEIIHKTTRYLMKVPYEEE